VEGVVQGILSLTQEFYQVGCEQPSNQVVNNDFKSFPTPCKTQQTPTQRATTLCTSKVQLKKKISKNL
jgi:hypothetical protein